VSSQDFSGGILSRSHHTDKTLPSHVSLDNRHRQKSILSLLLFARGTLLRPASCRYDILWFSQKSKPFHLGFGSTSMVKRIIRPGIVIIIGIIFMAVSNPSEQKFLEKVSSEYGAVHGGANFSTADLLQMGESRRQSYLIFSTYEYEFGTIGVRYVGFLFSVFHVESYRDEESSGNGEEVIASNI